MVLTTGAYVIRMFGAQYRRRLALRRALLLATGSALFLGLGAALLHLHEGSGRGVADGSGGGGGGSAGNGSRQTGFLAGWWHTTTAAAK